MDEDSVLQRLAIQAGSNQGDCIRRLRLAIACFDEAMISTIHGFCNRLLVENSFETQTLFESQLNPTPNEMIAEAVRSIGGINFPVEIHYSIVPSGKW